MRLLDCKKLLLQLAIGVTVLSAEATVHAASLLRVAAAADLAPCIAELNSVFAASVGGADVTYSIGASGNFYAQIKNGAPYDVFLSADLHYPQELAKAGLADAASLMVYAHGQLVMWTNDPKVDISGGLKALTAQSIQRIAIANPEVAPYGRAAKAALQNAGVWDAVQSKLVTGESIVQTAQFVETGNAQVGLISFAHVNGSKKPAQGQTWIVPANLYPLIEQGAIVTVKGKSNPLATQYLAFLRSEKGRAILQKYSFNLPEKRQ
ncbi:MAG: molybdate ABC transporter substrate-binding protein [Burkholderiaceae bacterium]